MDYYFKILEVGLFIPWLGNNLCHPAIEELSYEKGKSSTRHKTFKPHVCRFGLLAWLQNIGCFIAIGHAPKAIQTGKKSSSLFPLQL